MIFDKVKNIDNYVGILPKEIIKSIKNSTGEPVEMKTDQESEFELHRNHKEIFICHDGKATFHYLFLGQYNEKKDLLKIDNLIRYTTLQKGEFLLIDNNVWHKPYISSNKQLNAYASIDVIKYKV